jgi:hypothetical protein
LAERAVRMVCVAWGGEADPDVSHVAKVACNGRGCPASIFAVQHPGWLYRFGNGKQYLA